MMPIGRGKRREKAEFLKKYSYLHFALSAIGAACSFSTIVDNGSVQLAQPAAGNPVVYGMRQPRIRPDDSG